MYIILECCFLSKENGCDSEGGNGTGEVGK